jgi:tetratricopeptide (TPR) repeat protein
MRSWIRVIGLAALAGGCASGRLRREAASELLSADAAVLAGCYDCLLRAQDAYDRLAASKYVKRDSVALRRFETALLIALRQKELALDGSAAFERARSLGAQLPASIGAARMLAMADAVVPDAVGRVVGVQRANAAYVQRIAAEIAWLDSSSIRGVVKQYLALALDCSYDARVLAPNRQPGASARRPVLQPGSPPVIVYRTGICMSADTNMLAAVLAQLPRFPEAAYYAGSALAFFADLDGGERAGALLRQAYDRFPRSRSVTFMSGWLAMEIGDCETALRMYDETVAIDPGHEVALLQGTICLSRSHRDSQVLSRATRLLALRGALTQPAYYWRALSRYRLEDTTGARTDIDAAKALDRDANALTLAGIIENDQGELTLAEQDLRAARALPRGDQNCTAAWTLGLVLAKTARHAETADDFETAASCYDVAAAVLGLRMRGIRERPSRNPAYTARQLDALARDSSEQQTRYHLAALNAAGFRANTGQLARARELLDIAARDTRLAQQVETIRRAIAAVR